MTPQTRDVALDALRAKLDALLTELRAGRFGEYDKGDWRAQMHRQRMAVELRRVRAAIREIEDEQRPAPWPAWYADEPLAAYQRESR